VWIYTQSNITSIIYDAVIELQPKFIFIKKLSGNFWSGKHAARKKNILSRLGHNQND
jgi:hypothetical protein